MIGTMIAGTVHDSHVSTWREWSHGRARRFLQRLDPEAEAFTFQTFDDTPAKRPDLARVVHGDFDRLADTLDGMQEWRAGVFVTVAATDGRGRQAHNVERVRAVFVDLDGAPLGPVLEAGLPPHIVCESSPGKWHCYWLTDDCPLDQFERVQRALARRFGGDPSVHDLPRVMRLPGFRHFKRGACTARLLDELGSNAPPYALAEIVGALALELDAPEGKARTRPNGQGDKIAPGDRHAHLFASGRSMARRGLSREAVRAALAAENQARCDPPLDDGDVEYLAVRTFEAKDAQGWKERAPRDAPPSRIVTDPETLMPADLPPLYESVDAMLADAVFAPVAGGAVVLLSRPYLAYKWGVFHALTAASAIEIEKNRVRVSTLWLAHEQRVTVDSITFAPGEPRFCADPSNDRLRAINLWTPYDREQYPNDWQERANGFVKHIHFLIPDPVDANRFIDWVAHIEQRPGVLPHAHWLLIAVKHGIGRNWVANVLDRVWPGAVAMGGDLDTSVSPTAFNGLLSRKLMVVIDEVRVEGGSQWKNAEALKSAITEVFRKIREKYGPEYVERNCLRWLLFSNHRDALPIPPEDRRINVSMNEGEPKDEAYYKQLYALLDDRLFIRSVARYLGARDIGEFNPGASAGSNKAKRDMIANTKSEMSLKIEALIVEWTPNDPKAGPLSSDLITIVQIWEAIEPGLSPEFKQQQGPQLNKALISAGARRYPVRMRIGGNAPAAIWILRSADYWLTVDAEAVKAEVQKPRFVQGV